LWWRRRRPCAVPVARGVDEVPELLAAALSGGLSHGAALRLVADHVPAHAPVLRRAALAMELGRSALLPAPLDRVGDVLAMSAAWGAPAAPALRRVAVQLRADELARVLEAAERLPALLTLPTALCLLPACLLLAGAPLLAEGLRAATA
ncbi:MAG: type II secretion system F family protein, partial [Actinobacteria bacterium]|nr:type II secretion system F family protein [Actinomycetota bacterium]